MNFCARSWDDEFKFTLPQTASDYFEASPSGVNSLLKERKRKKKKKEVPSDLTRFGRSAVGQVASCFAGINQHSSPAVSGVYTLPHEQGTYPALSISSDLSRGNASLPQRLRSKSISHADQLRFSFLVFSLPPYVYLCSVPCAVPDSTFLSCCQTSLSCPIPQQQLL